MGKVFSFGILLITVMILLNSSPSLATKTGSALKHLHGLNNTTMANYGMGLDFLHSYYKIGRMLADSEQDFLVTPGALIADEAVLKGCGRGKPYQGCLPPPNNKPTPETCATFKRGCPKP